MTDLRHALTRLHDAAASGELHSLCRRHGVTLLVVFGSVLHPSGSSPQDVDLAVRWLSGDHDTLGFLDQLSEVASTSRLDLMDLASAGPVARERALVGGEPLVEESAGAFAQAQLAAIMERMDTAWLRRLDLELLAR